jgi:hypothetical protein
MWNTFITESSGQWIVTLQLSNGSCQRYHCDSIALARRWARLLGGPVRTREPAAATRVQPAA